MQKVLLLLGVLIGFSCANPQENTNSNYSKLDAQAFMKAYKKAKGNSLLIDVRTEGEYVKGTIEDAININFYADNFEELVGKLDTSKTAFIFCQAGGRSGKAGKTFMKVGFKNVIDLKGGYGHFK